MNAEKVSLAAVVTTEPQPGSADYVPPADLVPLPSKGVVYPAGDVLHCAETVEIRSMSATEEDIVTSRALMRSGKVISTLLRACLVSKAIDPDQMLVGDRNAILIAIRITGYGSEYKVEIECPECGESKKEHSVDLSQLSLTGLGAMPLQVGQNLFAYTLPKSGRVCKFRLSTGADDREVSTTLERTKKLTPGGVDPTVTTKLIQQVVEIAGETDKAKLARLVRTMPALDSKGLRRYMDRIAPGVKMVQAYRCESCSQESEVDVPLGTEFFWPSE